MLGEFKSDQIFVVKRNSQTTCMQKIRLEMTVYSQILLQSYSYLSNYLPRINREFRNIDLCTIFGRT